VYSISEAAKILGVSIPTLRRWEKNGKLPALRTLGGHRRYPEQYLNCAAAGITPKPTDQPSEPATATEQRTCAIYARVSSYKQSADGNLDRQIERIKKHAQLPETTPIFAEYGSGLNTDRRGLNRLLKSVEKKQISTIYIEYRDRLTRFGYGFLERYCG
jgi:putative resolvase